MIARALALLITCGLAGVATADDNYLGEDLDGRTVRIEEFVGRPLVVAFWASWCAPCLDEIPQLQAWHRSIGEERLALVFVAVRDVPSRSDRLAHRWAPDGGRFVRATRQVPAYLGSITALPAAWVFDSNGEVSGIYTGAGERVLGRLMARAESLLLAGGP